MRRKIILDGDRIFLNMRFGEDFALSRGIPRIYGAAVGSYGLTMPIVPGGRLVCDAYIPNHPRGRSLLAIRRAC